MTPRCALKIDLIKKSLNLVHWNFLFNVLIAMGFLFLLNSFNGLKLA